MIKTTITKIIASVALILVTAALMASPAQADIQGGTDSRFAVGPTMYQTNFFYNSPAVASTVTNGVITSIGYSYSWYNSVPAGGSMRVFLCNEPSAGVAFGCTQIGTNGLQQGATDFFNGKPSNIRLYYAFQVSSASTKTFNPPIYGTSNRISISWA